MPSWNSTLITIAFASVTAFAALKLFSNRSDAEAQSIIVQHNHSLHRTAGMYSYIGSKSEAAGFTLIRVTLRTVMNQSHCTLTVIDSYARGISSTNRPTINCSWCWRLSVLFLARVVIQIKLYDSSCRGLVAEPDHTVYTMVMRTGFVVATQTSFIV